jgi:hypothetical protein
MVTGALIAVGGTVGAVGTTPAVAKAVPHAARSKTGFSHPAGNERANAFCQPTPKVLCPTTNDVWSGYALTPLQDRQFTSVSASWTQPKAICTPKTNPGGSWTLFWVGLDGWNSFEGQTVEQGGSYAQCIGNGTGGSKSPVYDVWWEMYPTNLVTYAFQISAGDQITASVVFSSTADTYTVTVDDTTSGQSVVVVCATNAAATNPNTYTITLDGVTTGPTSFASPDDQSAVLCGYGNPCPNASAEWVVEAPGGDTSGANGDLYPLARYRPILFKSAHASDSAGDTGPILDSAWATEAVNLTNMGGLHLASVTGLRKGDTEFRDIWIPA